MSDASLTEIRAALKELAKALEIERACVLRIVKVLEREMGAEKDAMPIAVGYNLNIEMKG